MLQILSNYFFVFFLPFLLGFILRFVIRKTHKPYILTVCLIAVEVLMWGIAFIIPSHGSEANYIRAIMASCLAIGALIAGLITRARH